MKISMHNWMRPEPVATTIDRLARLGYDGIELASAPDELDVRAVGRQLGSAGIECAGTLALFLGGRDLLHEDSYVRKASLSYLLETIDLTAELGGSFVTVPGTVGKIIPSGDVADEWAWLTEALRIADDRATSAGVRLAIEPLNRFETYLINRADQARRLAAQVGGTTGVCLDIFHMNIEEADWRRAISDSAEQLINFHVADNNRMPPGQGAIDWDSLVKTLVDAGYDGWLSVEFMPAIDRLPSPARHMTDVSEVEGLSEGMRAWIRDHGSGVLDASDYDLYSETSIRTLRSALAHSIPVHH